MNYYKREGIRKRRDIENHKSILCTSFRQKNELDGIKLKDSEDNLTE